MERRFHHRLENHLHHGLCDAVGNGWNAKGRVPPLSFGISTSRTGGGKYEPGDIRFQTR